MKTLTKKLINSFENSDNVIERLLFALIKHGVPVEDFINIANHGAQGGYPAISYYSDTCAFYNANKDDIWELATDQADEFGNDNAMQMIGQFAGAKNVGSCDQFENLMCWYAAEEASRYATENYKIPEYAG